ncbi:hypothetical protein Tco_0640519 [Tanacetum coccineum]
MGCFEEIEAMLEIKVYEMGGEEEIFSSKAWRRAFDIKEPIYTELCHEFYSTYDFDEVVTDDELMTKKLIKFRLGGRGHTLTLLEFARRLGLYHSAEIRGARWVECLKNYRALDATTLKELIGSNGGLIVEDPSPSVPRVAMPRPPPPSISDLYDKIGHVEIRQGQLERMPRRQLYHTDRYAGVFEFMAGHYKVPL